VNEVTFLGYSESSKSYRVFIPESQTVQIARDIIFYEKHKAEEQHEPVEPSTLFMIHQLNLHETKSTKIDFLPVTGSPVHQIPCPQSKKKLCHPSVITEASRLKTATPKQYQHDVQMDLQNKTQSQQHSITLQSSAGCQGVHIKARHSTMNKRTLLLSSVTSCGSFNPP
jgi:hypothetical protein